MCIHTAKVDPRIAGLRGFFVIVTVMVLIIQPFLGETYNRLPGILALAIFFSCLPEMFPEPQGKEL